MIVDSILKILVQCPSPRSRKLVMGKTLSTMKISKDLLDHILFVKDALA